MRYRSFQAWSAASDFNAKTLATNVAFKEDWLQRAVVENPELVIAPCREADLTDEAWVYWGQQFAVEAAGLIDVLLLSESGRIAIVETKLSYNPEGRRSVVTQTLEYAIHLPEVEIAKLPAIPASDGRPFVDAELVHNRIQPVAASAATMCSRSAQVSEIDAGVALPSVSAGAQRLAAFREPAKGLSDGVLGVLGGGMVTEEALPSYSVHLSRVANDVTGTSERTWARWLRGWTAEENRQGDLLNAWLRLTGRVDMHAVQVTVQHLLGWGFNPRVEDDLYGALVYTSFQERATRVSHNNVGQPAARDGDEALAAICRRIAGNEVRHETFYTPMMGAALDGAVTSAGSVLRKVIAMPGRLMQDGKDPDLFDHFSVVAQRLGVSTVLDYAAIVRHLVEEWNIAGRSVSGKAARAQDFLCRHAEKVESAAEAVAERVAKGPLVRFSWIHDRQA